MARIAPATSAVLLLPPTIAERTGFDGVLIHGGPRLSSYTQFLSPLMNTRTDSYGGLSGEPRPLSAPPDF